MTWKQALVGHLPDRSTLAIAMVIGGLVTGVVWSVALIGIAGAGLWWVLP